MDDRKVSGAFVAATYSFMKVNYSPAQLEKMREPFSSELVAALPRLKRGEWYPLDFAIEQLRAIHQTHDDPRAALATLERCGRFIGDEASTTFLKLLMKVLTLPMLARKWQQFWNKYHDFGHCTADVSKIEQRQFFVTAKPGYPYIHAVGAGWIQNVLAALGKQGVKVETNIPVDQVDHPEIHWSATWD